MWKRISFIALAWEYGPNTVDSRSCFHGKGEPHNEDCHIGWQSGHKLHVRGYDAEDVEKMRPAIESLNKSHGTGHKFADGPTFDAFEYYPEQMGKAGTVYIAHPDDLEEVSNELSRKLEETGYNRHMSDKYGTTAADISGDHMIDENVGYRYDRRTRDGKSVSPEDYHNDYVPNPCNCRGCNPEGD